MLALIRKAKSTHIKGKSSRGALLSSLFTTTQTMGGKTINFIRNFAFIVHATSQKQRNVYKRRHLIEIQRVVGGLFSIGIKHF